MRQLIDARRTAAVMLATLWAVGETAAGQPRPARSTPAPESVAVALASRTILLSRESTRAFWSALRTAPNGELYSLIWLARHPSAADRQALQAAGISIVSPLQGKTYWALISTAADTTRAPIWPLLLALVEPRDRVAPLIWNRDFEPYLRRDPDSAAVNHLVNPDGSVNVVVVFHAGVTRQRAEGLLREHATAFEHAGEVHWRAVIRVENVSRLARFDAVRWIGPAPPPVAPDNDVTRTVINVDAVHNLDPATGQINGLGAKGIVVGVFDMGIDEDHADFGSRVIRNDFGRDWHGTHVAGVIAGDGARSSGVDSWGNLNGGLPLQWRGMAPQAELIDADANWSRTPSRMLNYIQAAGMDVSNHSYSYSLDGDYSVIWDQVHDRVIRGDAVSGGTLVPPRLQVYSTGNRGKRPLWQAGLQGGQTGYFSLTKQVKNGLVVGTYDPVSGQIHPTSSLGPAHDGRIKPDVVAPGVLSRSTGYCKLLDASGLCASPPPQATERRNFYAPQTGSSAAAPVVTGVLALVLQQHAITYSAVPYRPPLPSTLRAIAIQSALDITGAGSPWFSNEDGPVEAFPGPDFVTGYGLIDAQSAVGLVEKWYFIEDEIAKSCQARTWWLNVTSQGELRVTLAWDDVEGSPESARKLVNDLDLELVAPATDATHYPWLLDQRIVDAGGNPIADDAQACETEIQVERQVTPTLTPNFVAPGDAANINDPIPSGALQPAGRGKDHLNNLEQVVVESATQGWWQVRVTGFNVPSSPQSFSLAANYPPQLRLISRPPVCANRPCPWLIDRRICERIPRLCEAKTVTVRPGPIPLMFTHPYDRLVLPLDRMCLFVACSSCTEAACPQINVEFSGRPASFTIDIYDSRGRRTYSDRSTRRQKRIPLHNPRENDGVLVIGPGQGVRIGTVYDVHMTSTMSGAR